MNAAPHCTMPPPLRRTSAVAGILLCALAGTMTFAGPWPFGTRTDEDGKCWITHGGLPLLVLPPQADGTPALARAREVLRRFRTCGNAGLLKPAALEVRQVNELLALTVSPPDGDPQLLLTIDGKTAEYFRMQPAPLAQWWRAILADHLRMADGAHPTELARHYPANVLVQLASECAVVGAGSAAHRDPPIEALRLKYAGELRALPFLGPSEPGGVISRTSPTAEEAPAPHADGGSLGTPPSAESGQAGTWSHVVAGQLVELTVAAPGAIAGASTRLTVRSRAIEGDGLPFAESEVRMFISRVGASQETQESRPEIDPATNECRLTHTFQQPGEYIVCLWARHPDRRLNVNFPVTVAAPAEASPETSAPAVPSEPPLGAAEAQDRVAPPQGDTPAPEPPPDRTRRRDSPTEEPPHSPPHSVGIHGLMAAVPAAPPVHRRSEGRAQLGMPSLGSRGSSSAREAISQALMGDSPPALRRAVLPGSLGRAGSAWPLLAAGEETGPRPMAAVLRVEQPQALPPAATGRRLAPPAEAAVQSEGSGRRPRAPPPARIASAHLIQDRGLAWVSPPSLPLSADHAGTACLPSAPPGKSRSAAAASRAHVHALPSRMRLRVPEKAGALVAFLPDATPRTPRKQLPLSRPQALAPAAETRQEPVATRGPGLAAPHPRPMSAAPAAAAPATDDRIAAALSAPGPATRVLAARLSDGAMTALRTSAEAVGVAAAMPDLGPLAELVSRAAALNRPTTDERTATARAVGTATSPVWLVASTRLAQPSPVAAPPSPSARMVEPAGRPHRAPPAVQLTAPSTSPHSAGVMSVAGGAPLRESPAALVEAAQIRAVARTEPDPLVAGKRALIEVTLTQALRSSQGVMVSAPVEGTSLRASFVPRDGSVQAALAKPMVARRQLGVYIVYHLFRAPGRYAMKLVGRRGTGEEFDLGIPLTVTEPSH